MHRIVVQITALIAIMISICCMEKGLQCKREYIPGNPDKKQLGQWHHTSQLGQLLTAKNLKALQRQFPKTHDRLLCCLNKCDEAKKTSCE